MTGPEGSTPTQSSSEFGDYVVRQVQKVEEDDVKEGDVVYFRTGSGSRYVVEVEGTSTGFIHGLISRRGEPARLTETETVADLDSVPGKVYVSYDYLNTSSFGALLCFEETGNFTTSKVMDIQVIDFNPPAA